MSQNEWPTPPRIRTERPSILNGLALLIGTVALIYAAIFLYRWATEPISLTPPASPPTSSASPVSFPPELITMAVAVSTSLAPSPTPLMPTPTYVMLPTPKPPSIDICLTSTPKGAICIQPLPPLPTATPIGVCPALPGEPCVFSGGLVPFAITPTPSSGRNASAVVGSNN